MAEGDGIEMNLEALMAPYAGRATEVFEAELLQAPRHRAVGLYALELDSYEVVAPRHCADARDEVERAVIAYGALPRHRADTVLRLA